MKIGDKNGVDHSTLTGRVAPQTAAPTGRGGEAGHKSGADSVEVSDVARALAKLIGSVGGDTPDPARAAQVAILRNTVASGRYQPNLHDVAHKLLSEVAAEIAG